MKITNFINKKISEQSGITLVALVVTIIILLILAGITVASLTGDNGLIGKTGEAKKQTEISEGTEQLEIAVNQSFNKRGNIDTTKLAKNLSKINGLKYISSDNEEIDVTENTEIKLPMLVKINNNQYLIKSDGIVRAKYGIDEYDIDKYPEKYYGSYVTNYNSPNDDGIDLYAQPGKWQIFMADDTNIYLIASNYIKAGYVGKKNNKDFGYTSTDLSYIFFSDDILSQYNAGPTITDIPEILSKLDKQSIYHKWMNNSDNQIRNYNNEKAVASMLDIEVWSGYNNTYYAKYAIGGPTLEMFCRSYNRTHLDENLEALETNSSNNYGYQIKGTTGNAANSISGLTNGTSKGMYFKYSDKGRYCWIASPNANGYRDLFRATTLGELKSDLYSSKDLGFRPLICLNSNVHLVENSDGKTYSLELD